MSARCHNCDKPVASAADYEAIPEGEGEHLCWASFGAACEAHDWRGEALRARARIEESRQEAADGKGVK